MEKSKKLEDDEFTALQHWAEYGQKGDPPKQRTTAGAWKKDPFEQQATASWDQAIPSSVLPKLLLGFHPEAMEDKWFVYTDRPDAGGTGAIHLHRSWTGFKIVEAKFVVKIDGIGAFRADEDAQFTEITWESSSSRWGDPSEENAKQTVKNVCGWCMDVKLP